jgi:hypothetical protein
VLGGALPPLLRRPRLVRQGDRPPRPWQRSRPQAAALDAHRRLRKRRRGSGRRDARAAGRSRPLDGRPGGPEVPGEPHRPGRGAARFSAAGRGPAGHPPGHEPPPAPVPPQQPDDEPLADRGDARPRPRDVLHQHDVGVGGQGLPGAPAGRVLPRLPRHDDLRAPAPGRRRQGPDAGPRRPRGPGLLATRGGADGEGLWRRPGDLPRPRPRPDARPGLAGGGRQARLLAAADPTSRCPCR